MEKKIQKNQKNGDAVTSPERREFLSKMGKGGAALALGGLFMGKAPAVLRGAEKIPGKEDLILHNPHPLNMETPAHLLDDKITPTHRHFVRNNGLVPKVDTNAFRLTIDGEVEKNLSLSLNDLKSKFNVFTQAALVECGGNGRARFTPKVRGNQWNLGAVACAEWTGVRLSDVLKMAGVKKSAVYTGNYGLDDSLNMAKVERFSRGIPIEKAMDDHTMIAFGMNGKPIPARHGAPLRLVVPGWVGSASEKWLTRLWIRDKVHDSKKMSGSAYRIPKYTVAPGQKVPKSDMEILTAWQIKSLITNPADGTKVKAGKTLNVRGHAWAGEQEVDKVELSFDHGATWVKADLDKPRDKYAWANFGYDWKPKETGYYVIMARATDNNDVAQPFDQPWNPKGYLGNMVHRVPVMVS